MSTRKYAKTSLWVSIILVFGYVLSLLKEAVVANYFGVSSEVDAYTIALTIPVTLFALVSVAIQAIVVPLYTNLLYNNSQEEANKYISNLITIVSVFSVVIIIVCELLASPLAKLFAPGFDTDTHLLATNLLRITLPTILFTIIDKILIGLLNVHKQFVLPSFSVYLLNIGLILCIILLHAKWGIVAACIGQVVGGILQVLFLVLICNKYYQYQYVFAIKDENIIKSLKQSVPVVWSLSIAELCAIVNRVVASFLFVGSIAALGYASKINGIMMTLFTAAISSIVYPLYAESTAKGDMNQLNSRVNFTLSVYSLFLVPIMLGVLCFRHELIEVAFGRGAFDSDAVQVTASLLGYYCVGLLFMAFRETLTKVYYSLQDMRTPAMNATIGVIINIILNLTLPFIFGVEGLAIATSITATIISVRLLIQLVKKYDDINLKRFGDNIRPIIISGVAMAIAVLGCDYLLNDWSSIVKLVVGTIVGGLIYLAAVWIFKTPVLNEMKSMALKKSN